MLDEYSLTADRHCYCHDLSALVTSILVIAMCWLDDVITLVLYTSGMLLRERRSGVADDMNVDEDVMSSVNINKDEAISQLGMIVLNTEVR